MGQELGHLAQRLNGGRLKGIRVKTHDPHSHHRRSLRGDSRHAPAWQRRLRSRPGEMAFCPLQTAFSQAAAARYRLDALGVAEKLPAQEVVGIGASRVYWLRNPRALPWQSEGGSA